MKDKDIDRLHKICERCVDSYPHQMPGMSGSKFLGCHYKPYKGKWVIEIDRCPRGKWGNRADMRGSEE